MLILAIFSLTCFAKADCKANALGIYLETMSNSYQSMAIVVNSLAGLETASKVEAYLLEIAPQVKEFELTLAKAKSAQLEAHLKCLVD